MPATEVVAAIEDDDLDDAVEEHKRLIKEQRRVSRLNAKAGLKGPGEDLDPVVREARRQALEDRLNRDELVQGEERVTEEWVRSEIAGLGMVR